MSSRPQPTLTSGSLTLRAFRHADAPAVQRAYADAEVQRWNVRVMADVAEAREWIDKCNDGWRMETSANWAVVDAGDTVLGRMSLRVLDFYDGAAEIGYWTTPEARGRGVASGSLEAVSRWAFDELGLHRLWLRHSVHNPSSCRVAEKAGYRAEAVIRGAGRHADGWHDMHQHARIVDDPDPDIGGV